MALWFLVRGSGWVMMSFAELWKTSLEGARGQESGELFSSHVKPEIFVRLHGYFSNAFFIRKNAFTFRC